MAVLISGGTVRFAPIENALRALDKSMRLARDLQFNPEECPPLSAAIYALRKKPPSGDIEGVLLIDNEETAKSFCNNVESIKATLDKKDIVVSTLEVKEDDAAEKISNFMARFVLQEARRANDVIVDLTAGPKFIASVLYATANFCRITHIYYFLIKGGKTNVPFDQLDQQSDEDYEYVLIPPFSDQSLYNLSRRSYLELIFYLKEIEDLVGAYAETAPNLAKKVEQSLWFAVKNYFDGDYKGAIRGCGSLLETWTERLYQFFKERRLLDKYRPKPEYKDPPTRETDWAFQVYRMTGLFDRLQRVKDSEHVNGLDQDTEKDAVQIALVDDLLGIARTCRNLTAHKVNLKYQPTREDAKLILDIALSVVRRSRGTLFVKEEVLDL
ncbi:MAG: hypothetical protein FJ026_00625 [Chloroflexi bacterium]|nr:hypothetical protein [Chloroflexota bacterium]